MAFMYRALFSGCGEDCIVVDINPDINGRNKELEPWNESYPVSSDNVSFLLGTSVRILATYTNNVWLFAAGPISENHDIPPNWRISIVHSRRNRFSALEVISPSIPHLKIEKS